MRSAFSAAATSALMSVVVKLYERMLHNRIAALMEATGAVGDEQAGSRRGRSCIDHVFVLTETIEQQRERGQHAYCCFLDMS